MNKKLIVRIAEGLGNQLFMYAHAYSLSKKINYSSFNIDSTFIDQHKAILFNKNKKILCDYKSAVKLQKLIELIKKNKRKY